jgi:hypothetical protein
MKNRKGFVSNSSSSSFIIISDSNLDSFVSPVNLLTGEYEFGWEQDTFSDVASKLNFCFLIGDESTRIMTEQVFFEHTGDFLVPEEIDNIIEIGYIDHQSIHDGNCKMFESKEKLKYFLFNRDSHIETDNDNR